MCVCACTAVLPFVAILLCIYCAPFFSPFCVCSVLIFFMLVAQINKYAFSGGQDSLEKQRELGANLDVDVSYQWLQFFMFDDVRLAQIRDVCKVGFCCVLVACLCVCVRACVCACVRACVCM